MRRLAALSCSLAVALVLAGCVATTLNKNLSGWLGSQSPPAPAPPVSAAEAEAPAPAPETQVVAVMPPPPPTLPAPPRAATAPPVRPAPLVFQPPPPPQLEPEPQLVERIPLRPPVAKESQPVRVAILLPLSGPNDRLGQTLLDAAQLALFELGDSRVVLMPRDTQGTPAGAAKAAEMAVAGGAELVLGPLFATSVAAAAPAARAGGVNIVAFSTDRTVAGEGVYLMGFIPEQQVARVIAFARSRGLSRFAALAPDSPYGTTIVEALRRVSVTRDAHVVQVEYYPSDAREAHEPVKRLADYERRHAAITAQRRQLAARGDEVSKQALQRLAHLDTLGGLDFDALIVPDGGATLRAVAPLLPYYDIDPAKVRFLGTGLWDDPTLGNEPALVGGWFAAPPPDAAAAFDQRYQAAYGSEPPRIARLAYDAVALATVLAREADGPDFSARALTDPSGFAGTGGIFRFRADGVVERGLAVLEVEPHGQKVVAEAPKTFEELGY